MRDEADTMRSGLTTGTCAAAAAKAAALVLRGDSPGTVDVALPSGERVGVPVASTRRLSDSKARATVVKDAGDDPDVTGGYPVEVTLELGGRGVRFAAGEGVGVVGREGLQLAVGEPAINPVPRAMIAAALADVLGGDVSALVTVSIPGGAELAAKTFNPRLGITGGLSVIGTTGRVEPKSSEAWMRSLLPQIDVALAAGHDEVWIATGGLGEEFAVEELGASREAVVQCANFVGDLLDRAAEAGARSVVLVGHAGKLVKVAAGLFDTHSRAGDARLETVAALAAAQGAPGPLVERLLRLTAVQAAVPLLACAALESVWDAVAERAAMRARERSGLSVEAVLIGYEREFLGASARGPRPAGAVEEGGPRLAVVGVGPGAEELLSPAAWREIRSAEVLAGGARLLEAFAPPSAETIVVGGDVKAATAALDRALGEGRRVAVLASGDPGFFGILGTIRRELPGVDPVVVPGISSAQLAFARVGESWADVAFASAHGRDAAAAVEACERDRRTFVLADAAVTPAALASSLAKRGDFTVTVFERLGYPDERITTGSAEEIATLAFDPLSSLLVTNREEPE